MKRRSLPGVCVTMLIAPPMVLRPKSVPCGPFSTSMRSTSSRFWFAPMVRARNTPSRYTPTPGSRLKAKSSWPMPRIEADSTEVSPEKGEPASRFTFGVRFERPLTSVMPFAQNIQDVPIAITAFTAETIQAKGITDVNGLSNLTPNVNLDASSPFSGDSSVLSASIRGIGQDDFAFNIDPGVGVYVDGIFLARTIGANQNLLDVDRVEILKGPQGTLFGRNTIGGAINIVTHMPGA